MSMIRDPLNALTPGADSEFLVGTAAGAGNVTWESGATARTSIGLGTGDSPTFAGVTITGGSVDLDPTGSYALNLDSGQNAIVSLFDTGGGVWTVQTEFGQAYFYADPAATAASVGTAGAGANPTLTVYNTLQTGDAASIISNGDALAGDTDDAIIAAYVGGGVTVAGFRLRLDQATGSGFFEGAADVGGVWAAAMSISSAGLVTANAGLTVAGGSLLLTTDLAVTEGGTGASTAADARTNLGLVIGTDVQAFSTVLDDLSGSLGAPSTAGEFIVATGAGAFAYEAGATLRTSIGVGTGDNVTFTGVTSTGDMTSAARLLNVATFASGSHALAATEDFVLYTGTGAGTDAVTLPVSTGGGRRCIIKATGAAPDLDITPNGADTIDGVTGTSALVISTQYQSYILVDGASGAWSIV